MSACKSKVQAGFTMINVVVSIGLVAVIATVSSIAYRNLAFERKLLAAKNSYKEVERAVRDAVIVAIRNKINSGDCSAGLTLNVETGPFTATYSDSVSLSTNTAVIAGKIQTLQSAASRCASPVFPDTTGSTFRFCVQLTPSATTGYTHAESIAAAIDTFLEFQATMVDFRTASPITCSTFLANRANSGLTLSSGFYWVLRSDAGPVANSHFGFQYVQGG